MFVDAPVVAPIATQSRSSFGRSSSDENSRRKTWTKALAAANLTYREPYGMRAPTTVTTSPPATTAATTTVPTTAPVTTAETTTAAMTTAVTTAVTTTAPVTTSTPVPTLTNTERFKQPTYRS